MRGSSPDAGRRGYPFIPGHEWSGTVVEVGAGAAELGWQAGDRVAGTSHAGLRLLPHVRDRSLQPL